jgi:tricorn protease
MIDKEAWGGGVRVNWAPDSRWITYVKGTDNQGMNAIWIYNVESGEKQQVTSGMFADTWPTFDRKGDYLFFASNRNFNSPTYEDIGTTFVYANTDMLFAVPLRDKVGSPFAPKSDEEKWGEEKEKEEKEKADEKKDGKDEKKDDGEKKDEEKKKDDEKGAAQEKPADEKKDDAKGSEETAGDDKKDDKDGEKKKDEIKPIDIELAGFERRAVKIPVDSGAFYNLAVNDEGKLIYMRRAAAGDDGKASIKIFDLKDEKKKENTVIEEAGAFAMSADGKKLLVQHEEKLAIVEAKADQKMEDAIDLSAMKGRTDPRQEWQQMFDEAWRVQRDYFYDPNMHGVDWQGLRKQYGDMIKD